MFLQPFFAGPWLHVDLARATVVDDEHLGPGGDRLRRIGEVVVRDARDQQPDLARPLAATDRGDHLADPADRRLTRHDCIVLPPREPRLPRMSIASSRSRGPAPPRG